MDSCRSARTGERWSEQIVIGAETHQALHFSFELSPLLMLRVQVIAFQVQVRMDHLVKERDAYTSRMP